MSRGIAEAYLRELRDVVGKHRFHHISSCLQYELRLSKLSFEDVGTSDWHVKQMKIEACRRSAQQLLAQLVEDPDSENARYWAEKLLEEQEEGGFFLSEIGTSKEWLQQFFFGASHG